MASRVASLRPEGAYRVLARAQELERQGRDIIHLEIGEPDFPTNPDVCRAGMDAIAAGHTRYTPTPGIRELREAIAEDASKRRGIEVRPENVVVAPGAKPHLVFPTLALVEPGDEVLYPDPGFPTYEATIALAGGVPVPVPLVEESGFSFDLEALRARLSPRARMVILNSPSNPTGGVMPRVDLECVAEAACRHECWVLSDEVYARMTYDGRTAPSIAALDGMAGRTVIVDGFSKTYAMTGWRLGYGIMPEALAEKVSTLLVHAVGCTAHFTQVAGLEALRGPQQPVDRMMAEYQRRRDCLVAGLNSIPGVRCLMPQGAFYAFPNVTGLGRSSSELADLLLEEAGVAVLPGTAFGARGEGYLRLCYANCLENLERAIRRIRDVLASMASAE